MPFRKQRGWGLQKPPCGTPIAAAHPLAPNVMACLFNGGGKNSVTIDSVANRLLTNSSSVASVPSRYAQNALLLAAGDTTPVVTAGDAFVPTAAVTVIVGYRKTDTTKRASSAFGVNNSSLATERCGCHLPYSDGTIYWDFGSISGTGRLTWAGWAVDTLPHIWAFTSGSRGQEIWLDGVLKASAGTSQTRVAAGNNFTIGADNGGTAQPADNAQYEFFYMYSAQLPPSAIVWIAQQPFAMFASPRRRIISGASVAAPSFDWFHQEPEVIGANADGPTIYI
jgi:hypothetical protein